MNGTFLLSRSGYDCASPVTDNAFAFRARGLAIENGILAAAAEARKDRLPVRTAFRSTRLYDALSPCPLGRGMLVRCVAGFHVVLGRSLY